MAVIQDIPPEIIEQILIELDPLDVASFSQTCSTFGLLVYHPLDTLLWRSLYLAQPLDDPRKCISRLGKPLGQDIDWKQRLKAVIRARTIVNNLPSVYRPSERSIVLRTLFDLASYLPPASPSVMTDWNSDEISRNTGYLATLLRDGSFLDDPSWETVSSEDRQLITRLHTHFGLTAADFRSRSRNKSRCTVYAMRNYKAENSYGPFMLDGSGRVDWKLMESIHHVMSMHAVSSQQVQAHGFAIYEMSLPFCQSILTSDLDLDSKDDWAGIAGIWRCHFCYMDHRALLLYNSYNVSDTVPLLTTIFDDPDFDEVYRALNVRLQVTSTEADPANPTRPKINFEGLIEGQATMSGWVAVTPDGYIRWHFASGEAGNAVWSSEGVQVGGVRSLFGVLGIWTTVMHDPLDPVGPLWMRKLLFGKEDGMLDEDSD